MSGRLSKSRFQKGLQCPKALWIACNASDLADPVPESRQAIFDMGHAVGELAQKRFPGGVLVAEDHLHSAEALETTQRLLASPAPSIYEAAFWRDGVLVRADIITRVAEGVWDLYEVKSGTRVKPENVTDVAVQLWVLEGAGIRIRRAFLMHVDNTYVYEGGGYDLSRLFVAEDVTSLARDFLPVVPGKVEEMLALIEGPEPDIPIGAHCKKPYTCDFYGHCHRFLPQQPVTELIRVRPELLSSLISDGIYSLRDIPSDYPGLSAEQRRVCELVRSGENKIVGDLPGTLSALEYPIHFLDFETFSSALPLIAGTRPYQAVPFQWSDHVLRENADLEHRDFLYEGIGDPRRPFLESLLEALGESGSIVVYSHYENTQLEALSREFPELAQRISAVQARLFDLERVIKAHVHHPACLGYTSIKVVLPALVDDLSYAGLGISDGDTASRRYLEAAKRDLSDERRTELFDDLRDYCGTDTLAMVRILESLRG